MSIDNVEKYFKELDARIKRQAKMLPALNFTGFCVGLGIGYNLCHYLNGFS